MDMQILNALNRSTFDHCGKLKVYKYIQLLTVYIWLFSTSSELGNSSIFIKSFLQMKSLIVL